MEEELSPTSLGPGSLTWRYFGSWLGMVAGPWLGTMQNMHPTIAAAVSDHSIFFTERWQRLFRSAYPINGVVFDGVMSSATAKEIRDYHRGISGLDDSGNRYHALDPEAFYWAHATFAMSVVRFAEWVDGPLSSAQRLQLHREHVQWYRLYGVGMRPVPSSPEAFDAYWASTCQEVLRGTPEARAVMEFDTLPPPPALRWVPTVLWRRLWPPVARTQRWVAVGFFDPSIRAMLGLRWTARDERRFRLLGRILGRVHRVVPPRLAMHPRTYAGHQSAKGRRPSAPLVHTPHRNLPPEEHRNSHHYVPPTGD